MWLFYYNLISHLLFLIIKSISVYDWKFGTHWKVNLAIKIKTTWFSFCYCNFFFLFFKISSKSVCVPFILLNKVSVWVEAVSLLEVMSALWFCNRVDENWAVYGKAVRKKWKWLKISVRRSGECGNQRLP